MDVAAGKYNCYHCKLPVPDGSRWFIETEAQKFSVCCPGCQAVGQAIVDSGNADYYRRRTAPAPRASASEEHVPADLLSSWQEIVHHGPEGSASISLIIHDIHCAACIWLIEKSLLALPGIHRANVNYSTQRATVDWDPTLAGLQDLVSCLARIGYRATPYDDALLEQKIFADRRNQIKRLAIVGVLGMQIMMLATALYFGDAGAMQPGIRQLLRWTSMLLCIPVLLYGARPFFLGAIRDLRNRRPGMDVPVALGLAIAFAGSVVATVSGDGEVYFESVAMFTFLLLLARFLQLAAMQRNMFRIESLGKVTVDRAVKLAPDGGHSDVAARKLACGDVVLVRTGCTVPADGVILVGTSSVDESLLSGEGRPILKKEGDTLRAGSVNLEQALEVRVSREPSQNTLAQIVKLVDRAMADRPRLTMLADRVASGFVMAVLLLATVSSIYWYRADTSAWLPVTISILVVTCPCALSLAAPMAFTSAIHAMGMHGLATTRVNSLASLARVDHIIFDKTGTLTEAELQISGVELAEDYSREEVLQIAASLEAYAQHPIARALRKEVGVQDRVEASRVEPGAGMCGKIDGKSWFLGSADYIRRQTGLACTEPRTGTYAVLADRQQVIAICSFVSRVRNRVSEMVTGLAAKGVGVSIFSGDSAEAVRSVAMAAGVDDWKAGLSPEEKMRLARELQQLGNTVAMVGDGINDAPVLAASDVSIAMGEGSSLAQSRADFILLDNDIAVINKGMEIAKKCSSVLRQNFAWAIAYNALAIPAAVAGLVPPWLAAIGMSASSLLVVMNSQRIALSFK